MDPIHPRFAVKARDCSLEMIELSRNKRSWYPNLGSMKLEIWGQMGKFRLIQAHTGIFFGVFAVNYVDILFSRERERRSGGFEKKGLFYHMVIFKFLIKTWRLPTAFSCSDCFYRLTAWAAGRGPSKTKWYSSLQIFQRIKLVIF